MRGSKERRKGICVKRLFDLLLALCASVVLALPVAVVAVAVRLTSAGPALYWSDRVGRGNKIFKMPKFRSMRVGTPAVATHLLADARSHLTPIGSFLRKSSLDELPQLWNIFVGDMAVIGPRPALWNQYDLLAERDKYGANDVRPGLTGWAQIHGRDELEIAEKAKLDGWYVEHLSFGLDVKCFYGTIAAVLKHDGVVEGGTGTLHENNKKS